MASMESDTAIGLQHTRLLELTVHDIMDDDTVVALNLNGHRLPLPPEVAQLVRALRDQRQKRWHVDQTASTTPWLFPGQEPARALGATYLYLKLRRHGIAPLASRNSARLALATDLPASVLADFTGTSISNSTRWTGYAKWDWLDYIASRAQDRP
jgi:integrase